MKDPYSVLGVPRSASEKELKSAYRRLAKAHHPDQNQDDPKAHAKFAEISSAYDFLTDADKRGQYDRGEIDADGQPKFAGFSRGGPGGASRGGRAGGGNFSAEDILKEFMSGFGSGGGPRRPGPGAGPGGQSWDPFAGGFAGAGGPGRGGSGMRGEDVQSTVAVSLETANRGGTADVRLPSGKALSVKLPEKVEDGQQIRLKGQGMPSPMGGEAGDAIVTVRFERHARFRREGNDLRVDLPITLYEAVLGAKVRVPTLEGEAELTLKANTDTGKSLRLKGKGLHGGDLYVGLRVVLPEGGDGDLESLMRFWKEQKPYKVRES